MPPAGIGLFTVRIFKNIVGRGASGEWSNTYHILTGIELGSARMLEGVMSLVDAEKFTHLNKVEFLRAVVSTTKKDPQIQDGSNVRAIGLSGNGAQIEDAAPAGGHHIPAPESVLVISHGTTLGRQGNNSYRFAIRTVDWQNDGAAILFNANQADNIEGKWNALVGTDPLLKFIIPVAGVIGDLNNVSLVIAKEVKDAQGVGTNVYVTRPITQFNVVGVRNRQLGRRRKKKIVANAAV